MGILVGLVLVGVGCSSDEAADGSAATSNEVEVSAAATEPAATAETAGTQPTVTDVAPTDPPDAGGPDGLDVLDGFAGVLAEDGTLPLETALSMFAATFGDVPGVEPSTVAAPDESVVVRTIAADLASLTPEQRAVVEGFLAGSAVPLDQLPTTSPSGLRRAGGIDQAVSIVREALGLFNTRLGLAVPESFIAIEELPMVEPNGTRNFGDPLNAAYTFGQYVGDDTAATNCVMRLNRDAIAPDDMFRSQIAHELFHCFQAFVHPARAYPLWASEGGAGWIGEDFAHGSAMSATWWASWISRPQRPTHLRSYDAIGMYAIADRMGVNVHRLAMDLTGSGSFASYAAAVGDAGLDLWGTHYGDPAWGDRYAVAGPGMIADIAPRAAFTPVLDGGPSFVTDGRTDPGTAAQPVQFAAPGDVLRVVGYAGVHGGMRFGDGTEASPRSNTDFCLAASGCACPAGSAGGGPTQQVTSNEVFVGLGPSSAAGPQFEAMSLERFCAAASPVPPGAEDGRDACLVGRWVSTRAIMPTDASLNETVGGGAGVVQVFAADGTFTIDFSAMTPVEAVVDAPEDQRFKTTVTYSGSGGGTWSASGAKIAAGGVDLGAFRIDYRSELIGVGIVVEDGFPLTDPRLAELGGLGIATVGSGDYVCGGGTLIISNTVPGVGASGFEFARG